MASGAKLVALYRKPVDISAFEQRYFDGHLDLVRKFPNLLRLEVSRGLGDDSPYFLMAEMSFESVDAMRQALRSEEVAAAVRDVTEFAGDIVTILQVENVESYDPEMNPS